MVDWTILSPTFLAALVQWAGAVVSVVGFGPHHPTNSNIGED
jgi:hypothetical protein